MLAEGKSLSDAAEAIRLALGVKARILPMCDQRVPTMIDTAEGALNFQEYLVKRRAERSCAESALMASTNRGRRRVYSKRFATPIAF